MTPERTFEIRAGDRVTVTDRPGELRRCEVLEVLTETARGGTRCRVRWDDGGVTFFHPGPDVIVERGEPEGETVVP